MPNAPANVSGKPGNFSLTAFWDAATTIADGSPVTGYILEIQPVGGGLISRHNLGADVLSHTVGGLTNGPRTTSRCAPSAQPGRDPRASAAR